MKNTTLVQARTSETLKESASDILEKLGLNMSTYINMSLKQLVIQKRLPFEASINPPAYTAREAIDEVRATLEMEGMTLTKEDIDMLKEYKSGQKSGDALREEILREVTHV